jgi:hypothetical protein
MGLENKTENLWASVERIEKASGAKRRIVLSCTYGEYSVELKDSVAKKLWVGDMLEAGFKAVPSSLTDFIGQKPGPGDVVTASLDLLYLKIPDGDYVYKSKGFYAKKK